ncbi:MAG: AraC family transcriptional regulator [Aphanothece saxicola GSE-SYN-MK-01-06B]|nr:AraC family transcriptional regulator [Aphanothece saxicola GSE-SYN-MK-01-06B]
MGSAAWVCPSLGVGDEWGTRSPVRGITRELSGCSFAEELCSSSTPIPCCGAVVTIADIAIQCGFSSQSHLTRMFRKHLGTTPKAYRMSVQ